VAEAIDVYDDADLSKYDTYLDFVPGAKQKQQSTTG